MKEQQLNENQKQENLRISQKETELTIREKQILREAKRYILLNVKYSFNRT